jgi:hypothetical protein
MLCTILVVKFKWYRKWATACFDDSIKQSYITHLMASCLYHFQKRKNNLALQWMAVWLYSLPRFCWSTDFYRICRHLWLNRRKLLPISFKSLVVCSWRYSTQNDAAQFNNTQHSDTQHSDNQHSDTQHSDTQHNNKKRGIQHNGTPY